MQYQGAPTMRFLLKVNIPNDAGNAAARAGTLGKTIKAILDEQNPEAVYFSDDRGQRCGYLFIEMADAAEIPAFAEPHDEHGLTGLEQPARAPHGGYPTPTDRARTRVGSCHSPQLYAKASERRHIGAVNRRPAAASGLRRRGTRP